MGHWYFADLAAVGERREVNAFDRIALTLPVLSDYVTVQNGKPVTAAMFEDMVVEKPQRWGRRWRGSRHRFQTKDIEPMVEVARDASLRFPRLCFRLDWDFEHEEFGTRLFRRGKSTSHEFDASARREALHEELTGGEGEDDEGACREIDERVSEEFRQHFDKLWRPRVYRILYSQGRRGGG